MASLLIVDDDSHFRSALARELEGHGHQVASAASVQSALASLARRPTDVVLTDLWLGGPDGLDLLKLVPGVSRGTRTILMSGRASARDHQLATELGAVEVLVKPFSQAELLRSIQKAIDCETGFQGSVHGLSLIDMAQMFHLSRRSVTIVVTHADRPPSKIHFRGGEIVDASHGDLSGCSALRAILAASSGALHTTGLDEGVVPTIDAPFEHLLLTSLNLLDEERRGDCPPDDAPFDAGDFGDGEAIDAPLGPDDDDEHTATLALARDDALAAACRRLSESIDGALACAVVDVDRGALLAYHQPRDASPLAPAVLAAAGREWFGGNGRLAVGRLHEVQMTATDHHVFARRLPARGRALVLVTDRTVSVGLGWAQLRAQIGIVERAAR